MSGHRKCRTRRVTWIWLLLVGLTVITYATVKIGLAGPAVTGFILLSVSVKGHWIVDDFMGLRSAPPLWRWLTHGWLLLVVALVALAYVRGL